MAASGGRLGPRARLGALLAAVALLAGGCGVAGSAAGAATLPSPPAPRASGAPRASLPPARPPAARAGTSSGGVATGTDGTGDLSWSACSGSRGPAGYQCATLQVPLDYADPGKGTVPIALDRRVATDGARGSILLDPGGPGVSGVDFLAEAWPYFPAYLTRHWTLVGFDPRGVARSDPVTCGTPAELEAELTADPAPTTAAGFASLVALDRRFAAGCEARSGALLPYVGTMDAARDMNRIREALGESKLTYLGFSYGTLLGAAYAELYPRKIRAMVLDGAIDPAIGPIAFAEQQAAGLQQQLDAFFASCRAAGCGWHPGVPPQVAFAQLLARVTHRSLKVGGSHQRVGPAVLLYGAASALYTHSSWPTLGRALAALGQGDGGPILSMFDSYVGRSPNGTFANTDEAETAIDCATTPAPSLGAIRAAAPAAEAISPDFGLLALYSEAGCSVWPGAASGPSGPVHAAGSPTIVVVGATHDPVTPYAWAQGLAAQLPKGVLLTRDGGGHTSYFQSLCVQRWVDRYLVTTAPPPPGTVCPTGGF